MDMDRTTERGWLAIAIGLYLALLLLVPWAVSTAWRWFVMPMGVGFSVPYIAVLSLMLGASLTGLLARGRGELKERSSKQWALINMVRLGLLLGASLLALAVHALI
jgi:hypothetical protein